MRLKLCETHPGKIDLLLTDVVMPVLGGRELAEAARKLRPGLKVIFMSGHTEDVVLKEGVQHGAAFLHKPFTPLQLAQKVRETLDAGCVGMSDMDLRPARGLAGRPDLFPTADAVGCYRSPCGLGGK